MRPEEAIDRALSGIAPGELGVAVSGGGDSVALLLLASGWAAARGVALHVATVDHGLRPDAAAEAEWVRDLATGLGHTHERLTWNHPPQGNLQAAARTARYGLLRGWAQERRLKAVLLGHTRDDQAETLLMRLGRGSGVDGLSSMRPRTADGRVTWLRPLLETSRADLRDWLRARGQDWLEDPTNDDPRFDRVKIRSQIAALGLDQERLATTARHMQHAREALEELARRIARAHWQGLPTGCALMKPGGWSAPRETFDRLLAHGIGWVSGAEYRPRYEALREVAEDLAAGRTSTLGGCLLSPADGGILISREPAAAARADPLMRPWDGRWHLPRNWSQARALGPDGLNQCPRWRDTGLPRPGLLSSPSLWEGTRLIAAPLAGVGPECNIRLVRAFKGYAKAVISR